MVLSLFKEGSDEVGVRVIYDKVKEEERHSTQEDVGKRSPHPILFPYHSVTSFLSPLSVHLAFSFEKQSSCLITTHEGTFWVVNKKSKLFLCNSSLSVS